MMMNQQRPPTSEVAVRRAIMHGIDGAGLAKTVWDGVFKPACSPLTPNMFGFDSNTCKATAYNPDLAKRLLDEAGWRPGPDGIRTKDGQRLRLEFFLQPPTKNQRSEERRVGKECRSRWS